MTPVIEPETPGQASPGVSRALIVAAVIGGTRAMRRDGMMRLIMPPDYLRHVDRAALAERLQTLFGRVLADQPPIVSATWRRIATYHLSSIGRT